MALIAHIIPAHTNHNTTHDHPQQQQQPDPNSASSTNATRSATNNRSSDTSSSSARLAASVAVACHGALQFDALYAIDITSDAVLLIEIFITFRRGYYEQSNKVMDPREIRK